MTDRYLLIVEAVDAEFARNRELHGDRIHCRPGCTDCCYHVFPISALEAARILKGLEQMEPEQRQALEGRAREYLSERLLRGTRLPCPALVEGVCSIYEFRPLMCHKFGMPLYNPDKPGQIFACELNFANGEEIRDSQLIPIQTAIHEAWKEVRTEYDASQRDEERSPMTVAHAILRAGGSQPSDRE
jgi:uncharacterized protein